MWGTSAPGRCVLLSPSCGPKPASFLDNHDDFAPRQAHEFTANSAFSGRRTQSIIAGAYAGARAYCRARHRCVRRVRLEAICSWTRLQLRSSSIRHLGSISCLADTRSRRISSCRRPLSEVVSAMSGAALIPMGSGVLSSAGKKASSATELAHFLTGLAPDAGVCHYSARTHSSVSASTRTCARCLGLGFLAFM